MSSSPVAVRLGLQPPRCSREQRVRIESRCEWALSNRGDPPFLRWMRRWICACPRIHEPASAF